MQQYRLLATDSFMAANNEGAITSHWSLVPDDYSGNKRNSAPPTTGTAQRVGVWTRRRFKVSRMVSHPAY